MLGAAGAAAQGGSQRRARVVWMIKSERECAVTRSWVKKFEAAAAEIESMPGGAADKILEAERTGLQSLADEMRGDVAEYEALKSGAAPPADMDDFEGLPDALIKARIGLGMTQRGLAERMGVRERQVQEDERTGYESASCARLAEVRAALSPGAGSGGIPDEARVMSRIGAAGLDKRFVDDCIVGGPRGGGSTPARERKLLSRLRRIYGWTPERLLGSAPLGMAPVRARLGLPEGADRAAVRAHAVYAAHVSGVLAGTARSARRHPPRGDPCTLRADLLDGGKGAITLPRLVECAWDAGIAVAHLPPLAFHAAYFGGEGAGAVVLARGAATESRLMLDLAREMCHAARGRDSIDADEHDAGADGAEAIRFAHAALVGPRADRMFRACIGMCAPGGGAWDRALLGRAVLGVALEEGARAGLLADYVAYRLAGESVCDWRGAAQSMHEKVTEWRGAVTAAILARADLSDLSDSDFGLLSDVMGAVTGSGAGGWR